MHIVVPTNDAGISIGGAPDLKIAISPRRLEGTVVLLFGLCDTETVLPAMPDGGYLQFFIEIFRGLRLFCFVSFFFCVLVNLARALNYQTKSISSVTNVMPGD